MTPTEIEKARIHLQLTTVIQENQKLITLCQSDRDTAQHKLNILKKSGLETYKRYIDFLEMDYRKYVQKHGEKAKEPFIK